MREKIDEIRDKARDDARQQKEMRRGGLHQYVQSLINNKYAAPKGPEKREYDRVFRDEKKRG